MKNKTTDTSKADLSNLELAVTKVLYKYSYIIFGVFLPTATACSLISLTYLNAVYIFLCAQLWSRIFLLESIILLLGKHNWEGVQGWRKI